MKKIIFIIIITFMSLNSLNAENKQTFSRPDFNYPKTVILNADAEYKTALKNGDSQQVALALIQSSIAKSLISEDEMPNIVKQIEATIEKEKDPVMKSILCCLEIKVFESYYRNSPIILNRENIGTTTPADYTEWSQKEVSAKISDLRQKALSNSEALLSTPITKFPKLIKIEKESISTFPTMYDFVAYFAMTTDFYEEKLTPKKEDILNNLIKLHKDGSEPYFTALLEKMNYTKSDADAYHSLYKKYSDNPNCALILDKLIDKTHDWNEEYYGLLKQYITTFPESKYIPNIQNRIYSWEGESVLLNLQTQYTSKSKIAFECIIENAQDFTVYIYNDKSAAPTWKKDIHIEREKLFNDTITVDVPSLPYGKYYAYAFLKNNPEKDRLYAVKRKYGKKFIVSDLQSFFVKDNNKKGISMFVVNAINGAPVNGVSLFNNDKGPLYATTNTNGCAELKVLKNYRNEISCIKDNDKYYTTSVSNYNRTNEQYDKRYHAEVFTDLGVYRPGETVHCSVISYSIERDLKVINPNTKIQLTFEDSNGKEIETKDVTTDDLGRVSVDFTVPTDRLNGTFHIEVRTKSSYLGNTRFDVSEYKTPTFFIEFTDPQYAYPAKGDFTIKGKAQTYSNMPLSNTKVDYILSERNWWRMSSSKDEIKKNSVTTDYNGNFEITINADSIQDKDNIWQYFELEVSTTDIAGDSQTAKTMFGLGSEYRIQWNGDENNSYLADKNVSIPVTVSSLNPNCDISAIEINYTIFDKEMKEVAKGSFAANAPKIDLSNIPSGAYTFNFELSSDSTVKQSDCKIIVYRKNDKYAPVENVAFWTPQTSLKCEPGKSGEVLIGSSIPDSHVYYVVNHENDIIDEGWIKLDKQMKNFRYNMPQGRAALKISFFTCYNLKLQKSIVTISPNIKTPKMEIAASSFRDKIVSGTKEKWTLNLTIDGKPAQYTPLLCELIDKAVNSISPNNWHFAPQLPSIYTYSTLEFFNAPSSASYYNRWAHELLSYTNTTAPYLYLYDNSFFMSSVRYGGGRNLMFSKQMATANVLRSAAVVNDYMIAVTECSKMESTEEQLVEEEPSNSQLRTAPVKTALWLPALTSDANGDAVIEFTTPNFNTTWVFQALAYTNDLVTSQLVREVVTNKPIMVKPNLPRFVRQGDKIKIVSTISNSTEEAKSITATIEAFNPTDKKLYASENVELSIGANSSAPAEITIQVPDTANLLAFRVKATDGSFSDGEQNIVPVLPSVSPIIETKPFFIDAGIKDFSLELPKMATNGRYTFEYCNNPVWYGVTALPTINDNAHLTATGLAHKLYAVLVADYVAHSYPDIKTAIDYWTSHPQDSTLVSMLAKNEDLKIGTLLASPWINASDEQTLRMQQLSSLFDEAKTTKRFEEIIKNLYRLQLGDGGFCWFSYPDVKSSLYVTEEVLELIGEIKAIGAYPKNNQKLDNLVELAVRYMDNEVYNIQSKRKNRTDYSGFDSYAYVRSLFNNIKKSEKTADMYNKILSSLETEWKEMNLENKAFTAMTFVNNGKKTNAESIVESIRQFSITKPELGMYWDNIQRGVYIASSRVSITATILEAFNAVKAPVSEIDQIRKWIILDKQANNWGNFSNAAHASYALLTAGNQWLGTDNSNTKITIGGNEIHFNAVDSIIGYGKCQIDASTASGTLNIQRNPQSPAWGALYCQYSAPITSVKATDISELSIKKEIVPYSGAKELKVGDKVQVRLTVKNTREMDYVTLSDVRPSCIEPTDKLSHHAYIDNVWTYLEIKDNTTNIFIGYMPKGTHIVTYDAYVTNSGEFTSGVATIQCQYAPQLSAHSDGEIIKVE